MNTSWMVKSNLKGGFDFERGRHRVLAKRTKPEVRPEHKEQCDLISWLRRQMELRPELEEITLIYAIPNGGFRGAAIGQAMKDEGVVPGVPDLSYPGDWINGIRPLWVEMKVGKNKPTPEQKSWIERLIARGHRVEVCYSAWAAVQIIVEHFQITDPHPFQRRG